MIEIQPAPTSEAALWRKGLESGDLRNRDFFWYEALDTSDLLSTDVAFGV